MPWPHTELMNGNVPRHGEFIQSQSPHHPRPRCEIWSNYSSVPKWDQIEMAWGGITVPCQDWQFISLSLSISLLLFHSLFCLTLDLFLLFFYPLFFLVLSCSLPTPVVYWLSLHLKCWPSLHINGSYWVSLCLGLLCRLIACVFFWPFLKPALVLNCCTGQQLRSVFSQSLQRHLRPLPRAVLSRCKSTCRV